MVFAGPTAAQIRRSATTWHHPSAPPSSSCSPPPAPPSLDCYAIHSSQLRFCHEATGKCMWEQTLKEDGWERYLGEPQQYWWCKEA